MAAAHVERTPPQPTILKEGLRGWVHHHPGLGSPDHPLARPAPLLLWTAMNVELWLLGERLDTSLLGERLPAYLVTLLFVAVLGGGFEEPGWRAPRAASRDRSCWRSGSRHDQRRARLASSNGGGPGSMPPP